MAVNKKREGRKNEKKKTQARIIFLVKESANNGWDERNGRDILR